MILYAVGAAMAAQAAAPQPRPPLPVPVVTAPDEARVAAARRLLTLLGVRQQMDRMLTTLVPTLSLAVVGQLEAQPESRAVMSKVEQQGQGGRSAVLRIFAEELSTAMTGMLPDLEDTAARNYASRFSLAELDQLITFFSTGAGAHWLQITPELQTVLRDAGAALGFQAGRVAGEKAIKRAVREMLPQDRVTS